MMSTPKNVFSRFGFAQIAAELAAALFTFAVLGPLVNGGRLPEAMEAVGPGGLIFLTYAPQFAYLLVFWLIIRHLPKVRWETKPMRFRELAGTFVMMYSVSLLLNMAGSSVSEAAPAGGTVQLDIVEKMVTSQVLMGVLIPVVIGPVLEELVFRKLMIDRLHNYGERTVILFTAVCFGLFHGNLTQFLYATSVGLFLGFVYCRTGKIVLTMLLHMLLNASSSSLLVLLSALDPENETAVLLLIPVVLALIAMVAAGLVLAIRHWRKKDIVLDNSMPAAIPDGEVLRTAYLNPGVILYFLLSVLGILKGLLGI